MTKNHIPTVMVTTKAAIDSATKDVATKAAVEKKTIVEEEKTAVEEKAMAAKAPAPKPADGSHLLSNKAPEDASGLKRTADGEWSFKVWAPHAAAAYLRLESPALLVPLTKVDDHFVARILSGHIKHGARYRVELDAYDQRLLRRDPWASATDYESEWCYAQDEEVYEWKMSEWKRPEFATYAIYQLHMGSFTKEGTFTAAIDKLDGIAEAGFTAVQTLPLLEHADEWGYNPRQFFSMHGAYGTPDEFKAFVDAAHERGLAVIVDVVLHHPSVDRNALWEYDGWSELGNGGIYHEGAADTEWGRSLAFWKREVMDMLCQSASQWLTTYRCDGLRFDSANDLPHDVCRAFTHHAHEVAPMCYLTAEVTPENPQAVHELGFDALWVHSGYFDIIHQHRALGRGHHGGGDWSDGWDFPRLRTVFGLHYAFTSPTQCVKYILGSHDQVGCKNGGAIYEDYKMIGGQHRYAVDQFGGGRNDPWAQSATRAWWVANVVAAGVPMLFMGSEWMMGGWWDTWHRQPDWSQYDDDVGKAMRALVTDSLALRKEHIELRIGGTNTLHEDRQNGVLAIDRIWEGKRIIAVINAGRSSWQCGEYRVWVGGDAYALREVLCSADEKYGGSFGHHGNAGNTIGVYDGFAAMSIPAQSTLVFKTEGV